MDIFAIECGFWPWISRRKAGDALRDQRRAHTSEILGIMDHAERVRQAHVREIAALQRQIRALEVSQ